MSIPLTVVCFKWKKNPAFTFPAVVMDDGYSAKHVNVLRNMVWRNLRIPHRFVCVTDDPAGIDPRIEIVPLWDKCRDLGGCFNRLYTFSPDMEALFGPRFVCIDLDCVILDDITTLFTRQEDFIINSYKPSTGSSGRPGAPDQRYNGGLYMMTAGCRRQVWDTFEANPQKAMTEIRLNPETVIGSDQAWIRLALGTGEAVWGNEDGVYESRQLRQGLEPNTKIALFAGSRDPSVSRTPWVKENWR